MSATKFGRYQVAEPLRTLLCPHVHKGGALKEVDHEPKIGVLDQEDLIEQGIFTEQLIPGARRVDALGSCTSNANMAAVSNVLAPGEFAAFIRQLLSGQVIDVAGLYQDTVTIEKAVIVFYHQETAQTGDPSSEWPPTDCGSSGPYIVSEDVRHGVASGDVIASGADNIVSLMQTDGLLMGSPWLSAWMHPDASGFIDGDGSTATLEAQLRGGVAGGHETYLSAIEKLTVLPTGHVDPYNTVLRGRNSWTGSWGDHGSYHIHLSTIVALGSYIDLRQLKQPED